jgi:replicative DNA helicase
MSKSPDEADKNAAGLLKADPSADTERFKPPLRSVGPNERRVATEPAALDSEDALLGALLWSGKNQPDTLRVSVLFDLLETGEPFFRRDRGDIFDAIRACAAAKQEHDPVAVLAQLVREGRDRSVGGRDALEKLVDGASTVNDRQARVYAEQIRDAWARRTVIADARRLVEDARDPKTSTTALVERARGAIAAASARASTVATSVSLHQSATSLFSRLQAGINTAVPTGLDDLDNALNGGLRPGEVSVIAARPGVGKSTLAAQIAETMVTRDPTCGVLYVTLEMAHEAFTARLIASRSGVPMSNMRRMVLNPSQWSQVTSTVNDLANKGLYFSDSASQTLASIYAAASQRARILARDGKRLAMVVIDHIGLVKPSAEALRRSNREQQVSETSRGQRFIASELGCHVMGIAHISREGEKESANRMPQPRHLRESGAIENDADLIMIMHRERDRDTGILDNTKPPALAIAKARLDETAIMVFGYDGSRARFSNWEDKEHGFAHFYGRPESEEEPRGRATGRYRSR